MHSGKKWRSVLWLNEMHSGKKWWIRGFAPPSIIFILYPDYVSARSLRSNRPHSIYQYSNMALRLWGQNCKFSKFVLSLNSLKRLGYKENTTKYRSLSWKPRRHIRVLIYRTWPIENCSGRFKKHYMYSCCDIHKEHLKNGSEVLKLLFISSGGLTYSVS